MIKLPNTAQFSLFVTTLCLALSSGMFWAASWQWSKYVVKTRVVSDEGPSQVRDFLPSLNFDTLPPKSLLNISGSCNYDKQFLIANRKAPRIGPGSVVFCEFYPLNNPKRKILLSRGIVPLAKTTPKDIKKLNNNEAESLIVRLQPIHPPKSLLISARQEVRTDVYSYRYLHIPSISKDLGIEIEPNYYLERVGNPQTGILPASYQKFEVPPSTHFGYTIEWSILGLLTIGFGLVIQLFPNFLRRPGRLIRDI